MIRMKIISTPHNEESVLGECNTHNTLKVRGRNESSEKPS